MTFAAGEPWPPRTPPNRITLVDALRTKHRQRIVKRPFVLPKFPDFSDTDEPHKFPKLKKRPRDDRLREIFAEKAVFVVGEDPPAEKKN